MSDPSLSDDDIGRLARAYVAHRRAQPVPGGLEDRALAHAFAPHRRLRFVQIAGGVALLAGLAAVASVALAVHVADHSRSGPAASSSTLSPSASSTVIPMTATWTIASESESFLNSATGGKYNAVTCVTSGDCWAVKGGIIEQYAGTSWSAAAAPQLPDSTLYGISCASADDCWAVGSINNGPNLFSDPAVPLIEHYTGGGWSEAIAPNSSGVLNAVTCAGADDCWAVGGPGPAIGPVLGGAPPLVDHYSDGRWTAEQAPGTATILGGIACPSVGDCWAVGAAWAGGTPTPLIEHYSGGDWTTAASSKLRGDAGGLLSVACLTDSDCWAVGGSATKGQIAHDTNGVWSAQPFSGTLGSITCLPSGACWAVGSNTGGAGSDFCGACAQLPPESPVIEFYNGATWMPAASPPPTVAGRLSSVACIAVDQCWAVGGNTSEDLIEAAATPGGAR